MAERIDDYEPMPRGLREYLSSHGHHFSKPMLEWAVSMMRDRNGNKIAIPEKKQVDEKLKAYGIELARTNGYYDGAYVWAMVMADYFGSSIADEMHLAKFVKDYIDDPDNESGTKAFDHFYIDCIANGIDIPWEDII